MKLFSYHIIGGLILLLISSCNINTDEGITEIKPKFHSKLYEINGHQLVTIPALYNFKNILGKSDIYYYSSTENTLKESNFKLPIHIIGLTTVQEQLFVATDRSIATYQTQKNSLTPENYLPTPKGDFVAAIFNQNETLKAITVSDRTIEIYSYTDARWENTQQIAIAKEQTPQSPITLIKQNENDYLFWSLEENTYYYQLNTSEQSVKKLFTPDIQSIRIWNNNGHIYASGFDKSYSLQHFELANLEVAATLVKTDFGAYPPFTASLKNIDLNPILINGQLKGFLYGSIADTPIFIDHESKTFPSTIVSDFNKRLKQAFYLHVGILTALTGLLIFLAFKLSTAWESKLVRANLMLPENAIFFGPALNRMVACIIDFFIMILLTLVISTFLFSKVNLLEKIIEWALEPQKITITDQSIYLFLTYGINLLYGTISEYYYGQTIGKYCTGIKVLSDTSLKPIIFLQAVGRNIVPKFPPLMLFFFISNITILLTLKKKSLNDYAGNTVVIYYRLQKKLNLHTFA